MNVTWLTYLPAPYRLPVWERMGESVDLEIVLLKSRRQHAASPQNKGSEWIDVTPRGYRLREVPTWYVSRGESKYYVTRPLSLHLRRPTGALILGDWASASYFQALAVARRRGVPTIGFYESTLLSHGYRDGPIASIRRSFFRSLDAIVVPGVVAEKAVRAMDLPARTRVFRGFNAVDVEGIHARVLAARATAAAAGTVATGHRYLYIGQLIERKNVAAALRAFALAAEPGDTFTIAGTGELREELDAMFVPGARTTGLVPYDALPDLLAQHDTLVLPSTEEVWGLVVNEALAAGLHVVVSDRCGAAFSVQGMAGVTVVAPTVEAIRDGMIASRREWRGPIESPEILNYGPAQFARTFLDAIDYVTA